MYLTAVICSRENSCTAYVTAVVSFRTGIKSQIAGLCADNVLSAEQVLQTLSDEERRSLTPIELRQKAREFALETVDAQRAQFKRFGVWGSWDNPYITLDPAYEAAQIHVFGQV
jgi:valyl-tRNA synthetase